MQCCRRNKRPIAFLRMTWNMTLGGYAGQYKNFKEHLKPSGGIGSNVKRLVARESLQRPPDQQRVSMNKMFENCESSVKGVNFIKIRKENMAARFEI